MFYYRILSVAAGSIGVLSGAAHACTPPLPDMIAMTAPSAVAQQLYNNCIQQQRQVEIQRRQFEIQRSQMLEQQLEMQRQTSIQQQQLDLQRRQLEAQRQASLYPPTSSKLLNLDSYLIDIARNYNSQLPLKLDDKTTLEHV